MIAFVTAWLIKNNNNKKLEENPEDQIEDFNPTISFGMNWNIIISIKSVIKNNCLCACLTEWTYSVHLIYFKVSWKSHKTSHYFYADHTGVTILKLFRSYIIIQHYCATNMQQFKILHSKLKTFSGKKPSIYLYNIGITEHLDIVNDAKQLCRIVKCVFVFLNKIDQMHNRAGRLKKNRQLVYQKLPGTVSTWAGFTFHSTNPLYQQPMSSKSFTLFLNKIKRMTKKQRKECQIEKW